MPLPENMVQLARSARIVAGGKTVSGPLVADDRGVGVEYETSTRQGLRKLTTRRRDYFVGWEQVTGYSIVRPEARQLGGSTFNGHDVTLTLRTAERQWSHTFHATSPDVVFNRVARWVGGLPVL